MIIFRCFGVIDSGEIVMLVWFEVSIGILVLCEIGIGCSFMLSCLAVSSVSS